MQTADDEQSRHFHFNRGYARPLPLGQIAAQNIVRVEHVGRQNQAFSHFNA